MYGFSYWMIPIFSGLCWLGMLLGMLLWWIINAHSSRLQGMINRGPASTIAYISDIGATDLQPLFITLGTITVVTFDFVFIAERWLRHRRRLHENTSWFQKSLSIVAIIFAIIGAIGLICLTCLNDVEHGRAHDICLVIFIGGYIISAIFICWEYQRLGMHHRQHRILRISFWIKLAFIFVEFGLAIAFGVLGARQGHYRISAILEWVIALIYAVFVWSFAIDFIPAVRTHHFKSSETTVEVESAMEEESRGRGYQGGLDEEQAAYRSAGYANGHGQTNGHASVKPEGMQPSRNF